MAVFVYSFVDIWVCNSLDDVVVDEETSWCLSLEIDSGGNNWVLCEEGNYFVKGSRVL